MSVFGHTSRRPFLAVTLCGLICSHVNSMKTLREINPSANFSRKKNRMLDPILLFEPFFGQLAWEWLKKIFPTLRT